MEGETAVGISIEREMRQSYMDYAMSVIIGRALPDIRDGLKPVQRRVLYAMFREGLLSSRKTSKCAGVVGEVLKRYHPHGDSSVYGALVRLAQPWNLRYGLVDGQGNFGSIDGDPAAAYRYTECRMTALAERLLQDIDQATVDFAPNFDESIEEPTVLPSLWPNLIVNGADGIAVGMATHIPPHNLGEVVDGVIALIGNPKLSLDELMSYIPGPDFPTGGIILGRQTIRQAYGKGRGILKIAARTHTEVLKRKHREVEAIVVTEIPYQLNKARLIERIAALVNERTIEGVAQLRDESDREGMRIVIELKRDATVDVVLNQLFKLTPLQSSFGVINLAIVEGKPVVCTLKQMLDNFIGHRRDVVTRRTQFQLRKAEERMHILDGFRIALINLDEVIQLIKESETPQEAREKLMGRFDLSQIQAQAILDLRLQKLTGLERLAIEREHGELAAEIERLKGLLADTGKIDGVIVSELKEVKESFADKRRTLIEDAEDQDLDLIDLIEDEEMVVTVSHNGYIKRTSVSEYRAQKRGGKGVAGAARNDDFVEHLFVASTHCWLLTFTSEGRLYWLRVHQIPEGGRTAQGRALVNLLELKEDETVTAVLPVRDFRTDRYLIFATRDGYVKRSELTDFSRPRRMGVQSCTLGEGDELIGVRVTTGSDEILLSTADGRAVRFQENDVRSMGRAARGVIGVRLSEGDRVVGLTVIGSTDEDEVGEADRVGADGTLLTVCRYGYGKRTELDEYPCKGRGTKGVIDIRTSGRNGSVVGACGLYNDFGLMMMTSAGKIIRIYASDVSTIGRNTKGVRLVDLEEGEEVVAIARLVDDGNGSEEGEVPQNNDASGADTDE